MTGNSYLGWSTLPVLYPLCPFHTSSLAPFPIPFPTVYPLPYPIPHSPSHALPTPPAALPVLRAAAQAELCCPAAARSTLGIRGRKNLPLPRAAAFALIALFPLGCSSLLSG